jgi:hypothetical protein
MNIFVVDYDPVIAAQSLCNKHVVKMLLESAQLLVTAFPVGTTSYKHTHVNHPCARWIRESLANYRWLLQHSNGLCDEYTKRYGKTHKSEAIIASLGTPDVPNVGPTPFAQAMPSAYRGPDAVQAYRAYYIAEKARFAQWRPRASPPAWWPYT